MSSIKRSNSEIHIKRQTPSPLFQSRSFNIYQPIFPPNNNKFVKNFDGKVAKLISHPKPYDFDTIMAVIRGEDTVNRIEWIYLE